MRTLVVIHSLKLGGMERVAVNLADAFAAQGHDSHLLSCRTKYRHLQPAHPDVHLHYHDQFAALMKTGLGIPLHLLSKLFLSLLLRKSHFMWVGWLNGWLLARYIRRLEARHGRFDRIIFRGLGTFKYFWSFRDERNVYVLENIILRDRPAWQKRLEWRLVFDRRHLVCVSSGVEVSARQAFEPAGIRPASLRVITNPCPVDQIRALMDEPDPDIPEDPYIVNVARLVPQKGQKRLLEAYALARPSHKLVIVGDGPLRRDLEERARALGIRDRVLFAGQRENPYPWMRRAELFVLTSEYEGLGIVLTEALACGTPILSTDSRGGVRDVCRGELASCLTAQDAEGFARKLTETLAHPPVEVKEEWLTPYRPEVVAEQFLQDPAADAADAAPDERAAAL